MASLSHLVHLFGSRSMTFASSQLIVWLGGCDVICDGRFVLFRHRGFVCRPCVRHWLEFLNFSLVFLLKQSDSKWTASFTNICRPRKKTWFLMAKTVGTFSQNRDVPWFLSWTQKPWKTCEFHKIRYRLPWPKSQKLPNNRHNERAVVRIIENGAEISDYSALAWHCVTGTFLDGCFKLFKLTRLSLLFKVY